MFQYTKEVVMNDASKIVEIDYRNNKGEKVSGEAITIERVGEYKKSGVLGGKIDKTCAVEPVCGGLVIKCDDLLKKDDEGNALPGTYVFELHIKTDNRHWGEYANANWYAFGKPIIAEFSVSEADAKDAEKVAKKAAAALEMALHENHEVLPVKADGSKVKVEFSNPYFYFNDVELSYYNMAQCDSCVGDYENLGLDAEFIDDMDSDPADGPFGLVKNVEPFATGEWILENLRFPTYYNMRYKAAPGELPIPSGKYIQYSFLYDSLRPSLGGLSAVGQKVESVTRHIFYVLDSEEAKMDEMLGKIGELNVIDHASHKDGEPKHESVEVEPVPAE